MKPTTAMGVSQIRVARRAKSSNICSGAVSRMGKLQRLSRRAASASEGVDFTDTSHGPLQPPTPKTRCELTILVICLLVSIVKTNDCCQEGLGEWGTRICEEEILWDLVQDCAKSR